jgi:hypothetical protein
VSTRSAPAIGPTNGPSEEGEGSDGVEPALARALAQAAEAGRFDVVAQLAKELEARRLGRMGNVVALPTKTRQRGD